MSVIAKLLERKAHVIPGKLHVSEMLFEVPKDYVNPASGSIQIFGRFVKKHEVPLTVPTTDESQKNQVPIMTYLQGGSGFGCPAPQNMGLTKLILDRGYHMLYLDQRGTGQSSPLTASTLALQGNARQQADYLKLFRADNIVRDCEAIRQCLTASYPAELKKWSLLGQSFGGFCAFTYLSNFPEGLAQVFTTGGIPPIGKTAEEVYLATFENVLARNKAYYQKYPEDIETIRNIACHVSSKGGISLPAGGILTEQRLLSFGISFGSAGGLDAVHDLMLRVKTDLAQFNHILRPTLKLLENFSSFDDAIIYAVLHEAIYCEGHASRWAAYRVGRRLTQFQWLSDDKNTIAEDAQEPLYFSGEMIFPFMFETFPELMALREVAETIAQEEDWPKLYNEGQLARNDVPIYAATYIDDMYVNFGLVQNTVKMVRGCKQYITNTVYHDALRTSTEDIVKALFDLRDNTID